MPVPVAMLAVLLAMSGPAVPAAQTSNATAVFAVEKRWMEAYHRGDRGELAGVLAPGFIHVNYRGQISTRAQTLAAMRPPVFQERTSDRSVVFVGDVAIVHGLNTIVQEQRVLIRLRYTDVYVHDDGNWLAVSAQETPIT